MLLMFLFTDCSNGNDWANVVNRQEWEDIFSKHSIEPCVQDSDSKLYDLYNTAVKLKGMNR